MMKWLKTHFLYSFSSITASLNVHTEHTLYKGSSQVAQLVNDRFHPTTNDLTFGANDHRCGENAMVCLYDLSKLNAAVLNVSVTLQDLTPCPKSSTGNNIHLHYSIQVFPRSGYVQKHINERICASIFFITRPSWAQKVTSLSLCFFRGVREDWRMH